VTELLRQQSGFFGHAAAVERLLAAERAWDGTPFREFSRAQGAEGGIDCVGYVEELFIAAGVVRRGDFEFARTMADYQSSRLELRILRMLRGEVADDPQSLRLAEIFAEVELPLTDKAQCILAAPDASDGERKAALKDHATQNLDPAFFLPGDLLVLRRGGEMHLPVSLGGRKITHCARPLGVQRANIHDPTYSENLDAVFRARAIASPART
jgi:cell wall-associated NlpC family hydrolase